MSGGGWWQWNPHVSLGKVSAQVLLHQPSVWQPCVIYLFAPLFSAVLKWPQRAGEEAVLTHTLWPAPFVCFRWNTVMHSAVTHQWSGFFSPASDVVRAVWEVACVEVVRPPGPLFVLEYWVSTAGGGDSSTQASAWGWIMGCSGSRACLSSPCAAERVTGFYTVLFCSEG